jgi:uncharacterized phage protein gp47/JayE
MAILDLRTFTDLVQTQAAAIQGRARALIDFSVGSVLLAFAQSNAGLGLWLQSEAVRILLTTRASTSSGADLDTFVQDYGLIRLGSSLATGSVTFSRFTASAQAVVPIGARVETADARHAFQVIADTSNPNYNVGLGGYVLQVGISSLAIPVRALVAGSAGNVTPGTISVLTTSVPFVDAVSNAGAMALGANQESDDALRDRFVAFVLSLSRGTIAAIQFAVTSIRTGVTCTVQENIGANDEVLTSFEGFLCITVDDGTGAPGSDLVTAAYTAADAYRAGGIRIGVFPPILVTANIAMNVTVAPGYSENEVLGAVATTIRGYVQSIRLGEGLNVSELVHVAYGVSAGVRNVQTVTINGVATDLAPHARKVIRPGSVTVT